VEGDHIAEVSDRPIKDLGAVEFDLNGRTLMPGLIDAYVHVTEVTSAESVPLTLMTAHAARYMGEILDRGFTTVRDSAGADWGLKEAVESGLFTGPRLIISGREITQTGGRGDSRRRTSDVEPASCSNALAMESRIADGVPAVRKAARDELRKGADQIKVAASGSIASPDKTEYSRAELTAIVEEAEAWNTYVVAHAYSARAIMRAVECGVRAIEHGNLIDREAAELMAAQGAFMIPTLAACGAVCRHGREIGMPEADIERNRRMLEAGLASIRICQDAGVRVCFGTDVMAGLQEHQSLEFSLRAEVLSPHEIITSATATNAKLLRGEGKFGVIAEGALADILVVDGNPLADLNLLQEQGAHLSVIMKGGRFHKNRLAN
jgi:imidazolonepropionase-like amidohydrolase